MNILHLCKFIMLQSLNHAQVPQAKEGKNDFRLNQLKTELGKGQKVRTFYLFEVQNGKRWIFSGIYLSLQYTPKCSIKWQGNIGTNIFFNCPSLDLNMLE